MGNENSKKLYIPFKQIMGRKNADGTYTLEAGDLKQLNDILYAICKKIMGGLTLSDLTVDTKTTFNDMVTFTDLATGGSTVINGDNITTGTLNGIRLISSNNTGDTVKIENGGIHLGRSSGEVNAGISTSLSEIVIWSSFPFNTPIRIKNPFGEASIEAGTIKINSSGNASLDAGSGMTIYIGTDNNGENVTIGNAGGEVRLVGNVYINGVLQQ